jgi:hypothetical protein
MSSELLLGPVHFVRDVAPINQITGVALILVLGACMGYGVLSKNPWARLLLIASIVAWLFIGLVGAGISC